MKMYGGLDRYTQVFLTSAPVGGEWSASRPGRFTPGEKVPGNHWVEGWVDPKAGQDDVKKWKFLAPPGLKLFCYSHCHDSVLSKSINDKQW
jgi:hypothetical protein